MILRAFALAIGFAGATVTAAWAEVDIQEVTSPGGIKAWLVEEPSIPFTALDIRFEGGTALDLPGKRGATNLMMALLEEGAGDMDARAFAEAREGLAARFRFQSFDDTVSISAQFLTENRDESVALLHEALVNPRFDDDAIARVKGQVESGIRRDLKDPDRISSETYYNLAFGDHPYGVPKEGTLESVAALTRDDLEAARLGALALDRVHIGAVGDITAEELGILLDELLAGLPQEGSELPARVDYELPGGVTVVNFEGPQSTAIFGHSGMVRDDPDYFAAFILMEILGGGGVESRLGFEVREQRGLTYGIASFLVPKDHSELVLGRVRSSNETIAEAIDVTRREWTRIAEEGVTEDELERTKKYLTGAYPLRFDGNANIAGILAGMQTADLGIDYIATRNDNVNAVSLEEINRVARELLSGEDLHFVVVGEPVGLDGTN
ncbi:MAG: pitrilysin family protein [Pseudomonadota bacterium]